MRFIYMLVAIVFCLPCKAQSNTAYLGSCSLLMKNDSLLAEVSIGEPVVSTLKTLNQQVTQGFLQVDIESSSAVNTLWTGSETSIYPNPFDHEINIYSHLEFETYCLFDCFGKLVESSVFSRQMNLSYLNASTYLLVLYSKDKQIMRSFKIIKLY